MRIDVNTITSIFDSQYRNHFSAFSLVPASCLQRRRSEQERRRTQEQFRDDVLKIQDKDKEAVVKRRYAHDVMRHLHQLSVLC